MSKSLNIGKRSFLLCIMTLMLCIVFLGGCKKSNGDSSGDYYIRFKLNGEQKEYKPTLGAYITEQPSGGYYNLNISGGEATQPTTGISMVVATDEPFKTNYEYKIEYLSNEIYKTLILLAYYKDGVESSSAADTKEEGYESAKLTLTEITETALRGTFSGVLLSDPDDPNSIIYTVTNGEFHVLRSF